MVKQRVRCRQCQWEGWVSPGQNDPPVCGACEGVGLDYLGPYPEKMRGALAGLACGDALGATLEFMPREEVRRRYRDGLRDLIGGGPFRWAPGETTDDTAMALAVARGILEAGPDAPVPALVDAVGAEFVRWADSGPRDMGGTVRMAIGSFRGTGDWEKASRAVQMALGDNAAGNGALMRTLPVSFFWPEDPARTVAVSRALTRMTHPHPEAEWCSAVYNLYVQGLLCGEATRAAWEKAMALLDSLAPDLAGGAALAARVVSVLDRPDDHIVSSGYCVDTLAVALWAFWTTGSAEECIVRAAGQGGDADTNAAVAGGLAGAHYSQENLPQRWLDQLDRTVLRNCLALTAAVSHSQERR